MKQILLISIAFVLFVLILNGSLHAQGVAINLDGAAANTSAMLDVQSNNKGLLIPRVALSQTTSASPVSNPMASLMVYNTATANDVTPGYYYWTGSNWVKMFAGNPNDYILNQYAVDQSGGYRIGGNALIGGYLSIGTTGQHGKLHSYVGNTAVTTHSYNSYFENFATNTTTDAISKFGVCSEVSGTFTGNTGSSTYSYGVYATATGADNNTGVYGNGTTVGVKGITSGDGAIAGHFMNLSNSDQYNYGIHTSSTGNNISGRKFGIYTYASGMGNNYGIYAVANGGINNWAGYFEGRIETTGQIVSTVSWGTPPFYVQSSTLNVNLNADFLDGYHYNNLPYLTNSNISGTTNYVSKFNSTNSIANSQIFDNGTNVGVGTATPDAKFDVVGPASGSGLTIKASGGGDVMLNTGGSLFFDGNYSYASGNYIRPVASNTQAFFTAGVERMRITPTGNIGIGTGSPSYKLDVAGGAIRTDNQFISTLATGTSPLLVSSSTLVSNLNADLLDGYHASSFSTSGHTHAVLSQGTGIASFSYNGSSAQTVGLTGQALAFHNLGTVGLVTLTSAGNVTGRSITGTSNQITITNGNGVSANPNVGINASFPEQLRANVNVTGGGNISFDGSYNFRWDNRFITISNGRGSHFSSSGYYDITIPAIGSTITGVGGAANATVTASGIPLSAWQALYYIVVPGNSYTSVPANFRIVSYTSDLEVPESWILLAVHNGDDHSLRVCNGIILRPGQTWSAGTSSLTGGGTASYVPKWSSATTLTNSQIYDNGAAVCIGTTTASQRLTIASGGIAIDNAQTLTAKNSAGTYETYLWPRWSDDVMYMNYGTGGFNIRNNASATTMFMTNNGNVGIGTSGPSQKLHVSGNIQSTGYGIFPSGIVPAATGAPDGKIFSPSGDYVAATAWGINYNEGNPDYIEFNNGSGATSRIALDNGAAHFGLGGGNVGIGTGSPGSTLDVGGTSNSAYVQNLAAWGLNARTQGMIIMPEGTVTDNGAGGLTFSSTVIIMNPLSGSWIRVAAGTYTLGSWGALWVDIPPANARGATVTPTVTAWVDADRNYDGRDRILLAQRVGGGRIMTRFGNYASMVAGDIPSGSGNYIQNQVAADQSANFRISGNGLVAGNIGVGVTSPGWKLDVNGNARIGANASQNTYAALAVSAGQGSAVTYRDIDMHGAWSAGEGHAITASHATGTDNIVGQIVFQHDAPGSRIKFGRLYNSGDQSTYPMELVSNGSNAILKLNTDSYTLYGPNSTWGAYLQVGGNGRVTTNASVAATSGNLHLDAADGSFATYVNFYSQNNTYINAQAGNVGIGNTGPSYKLDVTGDIRSTGSHIINNTSPTIYLQDSDNRSGMIHMNSNLLYFLSGNGTNSMTWATNGSYWPMTINMTTDEITVGGATYFMEGNVGIGTTSPSYKLHINGGTTYNYLDGNHFSYLGYSTNYTNYSYQANPSTFAAGNYWANYAYHTCSYDGTDYSYGMQGGMKGYVYWGRAYTAGVQGWNYGDYTRCSGVQGYNSSVSAWGALGYKDSGGTGYGVYAASSTSNYWGSGTGFMSGSGIISGVGTGNYGGVMGGWSRGEVLGFTTAGEMYASYNLGNEYTSGVSADIVTVNDERIPAFSVTSNEIKVYNDGIASLQNGYCKVMFDKSFATLITGDKKPTVTVSPMGECEGIFIVSIDKDGFVVKESHGGNSSVEFTWIAVGLRADASSVKVPDAITDRNFDQNMKDVMFNENNRDQNAKPIWWDGTSLRFDKMPETTTPKPKEDPELLKIQQNINH